MTRGKKSEKKTAKNGANLGFKQTLWQAADKQPGIGNLLDEAMLALDKENQRVLEILNA